MSVRRRAEDGSALVIALVFISVFGLVVAYVLSFAELGLKTTGVMRTTRSNLYSADGAIEATIRKVQQPGHGASDCQPGNSWTAPTLNGVAAVVTCAYSGVDPNSKPARAILTTAGSGPYASEGGLVEASNSALNIRGGIVSDSTISTAGANSTIHVKDAGVSAVGSCTALSAITTDPTANDIHCSNFGGAASPISDPGYAPMQTTVPTYQAVPGCPAKPTWLIDFKPGYYDDAAGLTSLTSGACADTVLWFEPGFYYFDFNFVAGIGSGCGAPCTWTIADKSVNIVGGQPFNWNPGAPSKPAIPAPGACETDTTSTPATDGVQFAFGAESRVAITAGTFETCARPNFTNQEISVFGLASGTATATTSTATVPCTAPATTCEGTVTGDAVFANPTNVYRIDATVASAGPIPKKTTAGIQLSHFNQNYNVVPNGSRIGSVTLHVRHTDSVNVSSLKATVKDGSGNTLGSASSGGGCKLCLNTAITTDSVPITGITTASQLNNFSVTYEATSSNSTAASIEDLDGITVDVTYTPPSFEALRGCITSAPYTGSGTPCALVNTGGNFTNFFSQGTTYAPSAALDVNLPNGSCQVFGRGVISRTLHVGIPPSHSTCLGDLVYTVFIPLDAQYTFTASINGVAKLRAVVTFSSSGQPPTITAWSVL